jgi:maltooligosyltrehalose trehalohydrolase
LRLAGDRNRYIEMESLDRGYHRAAVEALPADCRYLFSLGKGRELPDPASRFQPAGVHEPSQLVDLESFQWSDDRWQGIPLEQSVFYEVHVGTYTNQGTFDALIPHLPEFVDLGITTVELMPVAQFPGARNWGYDGTYLFAPQNSYGGPWGLQKLVNAAHRHGLAVALDVVYNHIGPEGNYLSAFGPYFTDRYRTPWGQALNFDGACSDEIRRFFIENALYWIDHFHIDALRLDAVHGIFDFSARHFLAELKSAAGDLARKLGRRVHIIAESDLNDARLLHDPSHGGYGLDSQWSDDFHHSVHALLTGEKRGYYADFGGIDPLAQTLRDGWYYSGQYSRFRERRHGNSPRGITSSHFVVCTQNHDQVGNRAAGERLSSLTDFESAKLAAGITLLSPFVPLLFMGEEYAETAPFQYFTSHGDPDLVEAVRRGRREEFAAFGWQTEVPDPQDERTFLRSKLNPELKLREPHNTLRHLYQELITIRREFQLGFAEPTEVFEIAPSALAMIRQNQGTTLAMIFNFANSDIPIDLPQLGGNWKIVLHTADQRWKGPSQAFPPQIAFGAGKHNLSARAFLLAQRTDEKMEAQ